MINGTSNLETILKAGEIVEKSGWGNCSEGTAVAIKEFLEMVAGMDPPPPDAKIRWEFREDGHRYAVAQLNGLEFIIDRWGEYCGPRDANHPEPTKSADVSPWFTPDDYKQATGRK